MSDYDLVIRGGLLFDGSGDQPFIGDVAIQDGCIAAVGQVTGKGDREVDAAGLLVTPGFVDIHTHYDGQVTWENRLVPSSIHGVTTVVMGNCGVGFAPCRSDDRGALIALMEGVEDIPEVVMTAGLPWNWETFPEYLEAVAARSFDVDVAAFLPHSSLRVYVMGQRGVDREPANANDLAAMRRLATEAMQAGALGFATSRSVFHRSSTGNPIPSKDSAEPELRAIGEGMREAGHGVIEALIDFDDVEVEFGLLRRVCKDNALPLTLTIAQLLDKPLMWRRALELVDEACADGMAVKGQVIGRPTGLLLGLDCSFNPFSLNPGYQAIASQPLAERLTTMRRPEVRERILAEVPAGAKLKLLEYLHAFKRMFVLGDPPDYIQPLERSIAGMAERAGISPLELAYDLLVVGDGQTMLFVAVGNYADGNLDAVTAMLKAENTLMGLGDGGAHYGVICDAGYPTFMLTYWARDKDGERIALKDLVQGLTSIPAQFVGLKDRGLLRPGYKADVNLIDFDKLHLHAPRPVFDLPAGGRRLIQPAEGYVATFVSGVQTYQDGEFTGALPGRLVRGPQKVGDIPADRLVDA